MGLSGDMRADAEGQRARVSERGSASEGQQARGR